MTRLSQASDEDYARRINSRRKVNANLTMIAAGSGGAALALRGSKAGFGHAAKVASSEAKALKLASASKHAHKASDITGIAAGTAGSIAGINSASTQLSDIKRNKIKERKAKKLTLKDISQGQAVDINQTLLINLCRFGRVLIQSVSSTFTATTLSRGVLRGTRFIQVQLLLVLLLPLVVLV